MSQPATPYDLPTEPPPPCPPTEPELPPDPDEYPGDADDNIIDALGGLDADDQPSTCLECAGLGSVRVAEATPSAPAESGPCPGCNPDGRLA